MNTVWIKRAILLVSLLLMIVVRCVSQKPTVSFDYDKEHFNENQPLPAETYFVLSSPISVQVKAMEVLLYRGKDKDKDNPLFTTFWKRRAGDQNQVFYLPVNYKLRGGSEYDIHINYYRSVNLQEKKSMSESLHKLLFAYTDQAFDKGAKKIQLIKNTQQTIDDLNSIVKTALIRYKNIESYEFNGFSDLIKTKIEQIEDLKAKKSENGERDNHREKVLAELVDLLKMETAFVLNSDWVVIGDTKKIDSYPTEKTKNILTFQVGYGGTYLDGGVDDLSYGSAPQIGMVFPLGKAAFSSRFWSQSSIVAGFYLNNFENADGTKVTGPIVGRPLYAGLGYNVFRFVRFNAGISILEDQGTNNGSITGLENRVFVRPFVGLTADIKLWIDLAK